MKRAIIIILDSFGIGALPDADKFGDAGCNTLGHIDEFCRKNNLTFNIPNLLKLGVGKAFEKVNRQKLHIDKRDYEIVGSYGACKEVSSGKDTTSGHWEIALCPVKFEWGYFKDVDNPFPTELTDNILKKANLKGFLGNCHASGTEIIRELGETHIKTGYPIFYTSADSVFQIACHETYFGLENLYKLCEIAREELNDYNIARVIARPFTGETSETFKRTNHRYDYSMLPHRETLLDLCKEASGEVIAIGKIGDIYAHQGTTVEIKAYGIEELCKTTIKSIQEYKKDKTLIMTNLVDFDMLYGHRRDVLGYKEALEHFDQLIPELLSSLKQDDILILTSDHGCDPTWPGSDHTREYIPFLVYSSNENSKDLGIYKSFEAIGEYVARHLGLG